MCTDKVSVARIQSEGPSDGRAKGAILPASIKAEQAWALPRGWATVPPGRQHALTGVTRKEPDTRFLSILISKNHILLIFYFAK
jgi:hypothetical protein